MSLTVLSVGSWVGLLISCRWVLGRFGHSHLGSQYLQGSVSVVLVVGQRLVVVSRCDSWVWTKVWLPP